MTSLMKQNQSDLFIHLTFPCGLPIMPNLFFFLSKTFCFFIIEIV